MVVNTFLLNTTDFLNKFAAQAERKLARVSKNVQRLEIVMSLLEAKLDSIKYIQGMGLTIATASTARTAHCTSHSHCPRR